MVSTTTIVLHVRHVDETESSVAVGLDAEGFVSIDAKAARLDLGDLRRLVHLLEAFTPSVTVPEGFDDV